MQKKIEALHVCQEKRFLDDECCCAKKAMGAGFNGGVEHEKDLMLLYREEEVDYMNSLVD